DRDNKLWVYDKKSAAIFKFDTKGELLQTIKKFGTGNIPELVSIDSDIYNMLYAMDKNGTTYNINSKGENLSKTQWNKPGASSMAFDVVHKQMFIATASIFCGNAITKQKAWEIAKPWQAPLKKIFEMRIGSRMFTQYGSNAKTMDAAPYIDVFSNRTMVPLRTIAEAVGCQVNWIAKEQRIELSKTGLKVTLFINKKAAQVNGRTVQLDAVPVIQKSRTFVPLRFVGETFSFQVEWKEVERKIRLIG
ncbi:MAG: stalk domain-containing protein, partial [Caldisericia bacterium]|nr:stalk domain-containing protein [Caldisericia bacterium]